MNAVLSDANTLHTRTFLMPLLLLALGACSYTPIYPSGNPAPTYEESDSQPTEAGHTSTDLDDSPEPDQATTPNRVAIATPATVNSNASADRRRDERSATDELRAQARRASKQGELDQAERLLNRALRIAPREPLSYYELAELKLKQQQPSSALQMARKGLSLQPVGRLADKLKDAEQRASDSIL